MKDVTSPSRNGVIRYAIVYSISNTMIIDPVVVVCIGNATRASKMPTGSCLCTANKYIILDEAAAAAKKVSWHFVTKDHMDEVRL